MVYEQAEQEIWLVEGGRYEQEKNKSINNRYHNSDDHHIAGFAFSLLLSGTPVGAAVGYGG